MKIIAPKNNFNSFENKNHIKKWDSFTKFITLLSEREIPDSVSESINGYIEELNNFNGSEKEFTKLLDKNRMEIFAVLEKEMNLVVKNHFLTRWTALGMLTFGAPIGLLLYVFSDEILYMPIGFGVGLTLGILLGNYLDNRAKVEGRQIDVDLF